MKKFIVLLNVLFLAFLFIGCVPSVEQDDIIILYTNDVHCGIEDGLGYASVSAYKKDMLLETDNVTLVDCGDAIQGGVIGTLSKGEYLVDIMNQVGYELAVLGNHEFDYGMDQLQYLISKAKSKYLGCNIEYTGKNENKLSEIIPYQIITYDNIDVAYIGITTPESVVKSTPKYFMEDGEYVYGFTSDTKQAFYSCIQKYIDEVMKAGADYVVALAHLGDTDESVPFTSIDVIQNTKGLDVVLDGHAHSVIESKKVQDLDGKDVLLSSTGTRLANLGKLTIDVEGGISTELIDSSEYSKKDEATAKYIEGIKENYEAEMAVVVGKSDVVLTGYTEDGIRLVRNRETNVGNFCADAYRAVAGTNIAFVNGGGIRADIEVGDITYSNMISVNPFGNALCSLYATGSEILDALEHSVRNVEEEHSKDGLAVGENGGFLSVSGLKFSVDLSVESSVVLDGNGMFVEVSGERRVKDVYVLNENGEYVPLQEDKVYTLASHTYMLRNGGDGYTMFQDNELIIAEGISDYQVLITYLKDYLNGVIDDKYQNIEGRITLE